MSARLHAMIVCCLQYAALATLRARSVLMVTLVAALTPAVASARTHALLIGVSSYPSLSQEYQLAGPANDVALYRQLLLERGAATADIRVLADGVQGGALPTRSAILEAFQGLTAKANTGDLIFVLMAGHGSQQPAAPGSNEPDGLDEIFLPRDVGRWRGETGSVANAITDTELSAALWKLRATGAVVWGVFDACHAGTLARAEPLFAQRDRYVPADLLGIDAATLADASSRAMESAGTRSMAGEHRLATADGVGDYMYFYASQSHETTPELRLPAYSPQARVHGLFSYTLYRALSAAPGLSYRQTIERVLHAYASQGREAPSPVYEGSLLDAPSFGDARSGRQLQWLVQRQADRLQLQAGELHGVGKDSILAIVPSATARADQVLGHVRVTRATLTSATVVPVSYADTPEFPTRRVPPSAYARPVDLKLDFRLRVGMALNTYCQAPGPNLRRAIAELRHQEQRSPRLLWPAPSQAADVYLCQRGRRVLLLDALQDPSDQASAIAVSSSGTPATGVLVAVLRRQLLVAAHAVDLSRIVAAHPQQAQIDVALQMQPGCSMGFTCSPMPRGFAPHDHMQLCDGDQVTVDLSNPRFEPVDVTVLYIDAAYGVKTLYPYAADESARLEPKGRQRFNIQIADEPSGVERLLVLTAQVTPQSPIVSFSSLAQPGLPSVERDGTSAGLDLQQAAFASSPLTSSRGTSTGTTGAIGATTYAWTVATRGCKASQGQP